MDDRDESGDDRRLVARSAAGMYGGAAFIGVVEATVPGGPQFSLVPTLLALIVLGVTFTLGPRAPRPALAILGPMGAAIVALTLATTASVGDGAVLYMWPAVWTAYFFGNRGTAFIVVWIAMVHGIALVVMKHGDADRWIDVVSAVLVVAVLVRVLAARNQRLVVRLADEARLDPLTGLLNRRGLDERLGQELSRAVRDRASLTLVAFDIDEFKEINDRHGHEIGDRVLVRLGRVLADEARGVDLVARLGGDEFLAVLPGAGLAGGTDYAERVRAAVVSRPDRREAGLEDRLGFTVSAGVAAEVAPIHAQTLLDQADRALYRAKVAGRDLVVAA
jgi:diguanylate cyclase (GGDEF)-like protein